MQIDFVILIVCIILGFIILAWLGKRELDKLSHPKDDRTMIEWLKSMQLTIESTNKALHEAMRGQTSDVSRQLQSNSQQLNERLDTAARVIGDLKKILEK